MFSRLLAMFSQLTSVYYKPQFNTTIFDASSLKFDSSEPPTGTFPVFVFARSSSSRSARRFLVSREAVGCIWQLLSAQAGNFPAVQPLLPTLFSCFVHRKNGDFCEFSRVYNELQASEALVKVKKCILLGSSIWRHHFQTSGVKVQVHLLALPAGWSL